MKKREIWNFLSLIIVFLLMIELGISIDIQLSKSFYQPQETLQAKITGNFVSLKPENIQIYKQGIPREFPVISGFTKQDDIYYFYAILPSQEGDFSLKIIDSKYISSGEISSEIIQKDFTIEKTNQSYLSINPGFIISDEDEISVKLKSLNGNTELTAVLSSDKKNITIFDEVEKTVSFSAQGLGGRTELSLNDYIVPVFIKETSEIPVLEYSDLIFTPSDIGGTITSGKDYFFKIILFNSGEKNIKDITIINGLNAVISPSVIPSLDAGDSLSINISISIPEESNNISGEIKAEYQGKSSALPINLKVTSEQSEVNLSGTSITSTLSCFEIGKICLEDQNCNGKSTASSEGPCCLGECIGTKKSGNNMMYGIILVILLLLVIAYFYWRFSNKKVLKSTDEMLEEKTKKFRKRMNPAEEVHGGLDRI